MQSGPSKNTGLRHVPAGKPPHIRVGVLRAVWLFVLAGAAAYAQAGCPSITFQGAASASLKPSTTTHTVLLRQRDGSYTAFELTDAAPYRIVRATPNFQRQLTGCPGAPAAGFLPTLQPPESFTRLASGGYLWVRRSDVNGQPGAYFSLIAVVFDASMNFLSESQLPILIVEAFTVADVNGDGLPDILTASAFPHSSALQVLLGSGGSNFQPPVNYPIVGSLNAQQVETADLNGDGKLDVLVASGPNKLSVFMGNGDGTFQAEQTPFGGPCSAVAIADLNHDGKLDLACTQGNAAVAVELGAGDGTFGAATTYTVAWGDSIAVADLNGDGNPDIVTSGFTILFGDGSGRFPNRADYWQEAKGQIILTDFDGDGKIDIVTGMGSPSALVGPMAAVLFGRGGGKFAGPPLTPVHGLPAPNNSVRALTAGDFDGDSIPDLLVLELFEIDVVRGLGDGTFRNTFSYTPASGYPETTTTADFNRDGKPDIVIAVSGLSPRIEILLGKGDGTFQAPIAAAVLPAAAVAIAVGDFNGDGRPDLAVLINGNQLLVYLGNGAGGLTAPTTYATASGPQSVAVADFNGDGKLDLVVASGGTPGGAGSVGGNLNIYFGKGDGTFAGPVVVGLGVDNPQVSTVTAADFNRDGIVDLAAIVGQNLMILLGPGDGTFRTPIIHGNSTAITGGFGLIAADLDGDGIPDLIRTDAAIWRIGNGDGTFQPEIAFGTAAYPFFTATAAADFNRDGKLDLAGGTFTSGVVTLLNISQPAPLTVVNAASFMPGPLAPDSLATAFGAGLAGAPVTVAGIPATVLYSDARQVNFVVPAGIPARSATVTASSLSTSVPIAPVAPALFAACYVTRFGDQAFLSLFGTGIRGAGPLGVRVRIQGIDVPVVYAGPQLQFTGLDQVNVLLPAALAGAGDVGIVLSAGGTDAPTVHVSVK